MNPTLSAPASILITMSVLSGWFITDYRFGDVVYAVAAMVNESSSHLIQGIEMSPATTTPDIATNWFSGSTARVASQFPAGQSRKNDEDEHIAQGRIVGQSFGNDRSID